MDTPVKVLYLVGTTRCGSTLIGSLLGQVAGVVHVGELARIWEEGFVENVRCGCGEPFDRCRFWSAVVERAFGGGPPVDPRAMMETAARWARTRHAGALLSARSRRRILREMTPHSDAMVRLYRAVRESAGARIVLDSSKAPLLAWVASERPDIDLDVLHVTRDPRAVVYSWRRKKFDPARGRDMHKESPVKTSLGWMAWNGLASSIWDGSGGRQRYLRVRYEDFAADPRAVLARILGWLGDPTDPASLVADDRRFTSRPEHTIAGNPMRFQRGAVTISPDTAWQAETSARDKLLVASLTWPLLGRYGYPLRA